MKRPADYARVKSGTYVVAGRIWKVRDEGNCTSAEGLAADNKTKVTYGARHDSISGDIRDSKRILAITVDSATVEDPALAALVEQAFKAIEAAAKIRRQEDTAKHDLAEAKVRLAAERDATKHAEALAKLNKR